MALNRFFRMPFPTPTSTSLRPTPVPPLTAVGSAPDVLARSLAGEYLTEKKEERAEEARRNRSRKPWRQIVSVAIIVACGAVWLVPSLGTRPVPAVSAARLDGSARLTLFFSAQRVREFERRNRRLPITAVQSGISDTRVEYRLTGPNTFTLSLTHQGRRWDLPSTLADSMYLRDALIRIGASK